MFKKLAVIILNWNHKEDLKETIESFLNQNYSNYHIIVSDNGSTDGSLELLDQEYKENITVIKNGKNLGFAGGNNVAIKKAIELQSEYILLSNNDIKIDDPDLLDDLVSKYDQISEQNVRILGPEEYYYSKPDILYTDGWIMYPESIDKSRVFNSYRMKFSLPAKYSDVKIVDFVSGSFILFDMNLVKEIGLLDENYFMYAEEVDFCLRAWKKGYASGTLIGKKIHHKVAASSGVNSPFSTYYRTRNRLYLLRKHRKYFENIKYFELINYLHSLKNIVQFVIKTLLLKDTILVRAKVIAFNDFIFSKMGKSIKY